MSSKEIYHYFGSHFVFLNRSFLLLGCLSVGAVICSCVIGLMGLMLITLSGRDRLSLVWGLPSATLAQITLTSKLLRSAEQFN